jgi:hypothetical protein
MQVHEGAGENTHPREESPLQIQPKHHLSAHKMNQGLRNFVGYRSLWLHARCSFVWLHEKLETSRILYARVGHQGRSASFTGYRGHRSACCVCHAAWAPQRLQWAPQWLLLLPCCLPLHTH